MNKIFAVEELGVGLDAFHIPLMEVVFDALGAPENTEDFVPRDYLSEEWWDGSTPVNASFDRALRFIAFAKRQVAEMREVIQGEGVNDGPID